MRYGDLTYEEIRHLAGDDIEVVLPLGCTDQQGPHLPVDFDTWFAESLMLAAADRVEQLHRRTVLVLPAVPVGPTPEHRSFRAGYLNLPAELQDQLVIAIADSIIDQGFRRLVIWRGCGQHDQRQVVDDLNRRHPEPSRTPDWQAPDLDFGRYSDSGVIGDPRHATAELGHRLWQASVTWATDYLISTH